MTHQDQYPAIDDRTALLIEHGPAAMAAAGGVRRAARLRAAQANSRSDRTLARSLFGSASVSACSGTTAVF